MASLCSVEDCDEPSRSRGMCVRHYARAWRQENQDVKRAADAKWRAANAERKREKDAEWRAANAESAAVAQKRWRAANRDKETKRRMAWDRDHPDRLRERMQARRARVKGAFVEKVDLAEIWLRDGGACGICREPVDSTVRHPDPMSKSLDHIVPLARGGLHEASNAQVAHLICNIRKGSRLT